MPRVTRELAPGDIYHLYSRGSNRQAVFLYDTDRIDFLRGLQRAFTRHEVACLAYCLMGNHYHVLVESPGPRLSQAIKEANGLYALRFNRRYERDAHVWKNRFGAVLQGSLEQFAATVRYIVRNPVTAGLCRRPFEYPWSSYRATVGLEPAPPFLHVGRLFAHLGYSSVDAIAAFESLAVDDAELPAGGSV